MKDDASGEQLQAGEAKLHDFFYKALKIFFCRRILSTMLFLNKWNGPIHIKWMSEFLVKTHLIFSEMFFVNVGNWLASLKIPGIHLMLFL